MLLGAFSVSFAVRDLAGGRGRATAPDTVSRFCRLGAGVRDGYLWAMQSAATTPKDYLASLPADRRKAISTLRALVRKNLPKGYREVMQWGMIGWVIPLSRYPDTYNGEPLCVAGLASQKNAMSLYLMTVYGNKDIETWFKTEYAKTGKKLDMGKSCLRFRTLEDLPLELIGRTIGRVSVDQYIATYERARFSAGSRRAMMQRASWRMR